MPNATVGADAPASLKIAIDSEISRLQVGAIVADALLEEATARKKRAEAAAEAEAKEEEPKRRASQEFAATYHGWLAAKAGIEDPEAEDDELAARYRVESDAERRLVTTPAAWPDQLWSKLGAFEAILAHELVSGERRDSIIMIALASIKQDFHNLGLRDGSAS